MPTIRPSPVSTAAGTLDAGTFPDLSLPVPIPLPPMEATRADQLPDGDEWQFEPKWDGFRCLAFRKGTTVVLQSKSGQPLTRYFPELEHAFASLPSHAFVLDGEIVVAQDGRLSFDDLLLRIHPAASRVAKLAKETPATFIAFDLLYDASEEPSLMTRPLTERRTRLERFFSSFPENPLIQLSPVSRDRTIASRWFTDLGAYGLDGIMAKKIHEPYHAGDRHAMMKVKYMKTADCVVGGFRYSSTPAKADKANRASGRTVGSLLLGLYDTAGLLHFVGFTSSFNKEDRARLKDAVEPLKGGVGFSGKAPGGPNRWSQRQSDDWERVDPVLVCEVQYDYFSQGRFRHGTKFLRWRPEKGPRQCTLDQVEGDRTEENSKRVLRKNDDAHKLFPRLFP
ncbi:MAG TPA: ATP-dependent DNA ligase [Nitrospiraceae bacterium]|nr:ATP-dependent DNA ligase [Nitrospiraceae bacterium]